MKHTSAPESGKTPEVSAFLTSYSHGKYLRESIDSVLAQTYTDFELIIWDDASTLWCFYKHKPQQASLVAVFFQKRLRTALPDARPIVQAVLRAYMTMFNIFQDEGRAKPIYEQ